MVPQVAPFPPSAHPKLATYPNLCSTLYLRRAHMSDLAQPDTHQNTSREHIYFAVI